MSKKETIIVCTNPKKYRLTKNKEYSISCKRDGFYYLINDIGKKTKYSTNLFSEVQENDSIKDIINSIIVQNSNRITFSYNSERYTIQYNITIGGRTDISCGIHTISNINSVAAHINSFGYPKDIPSLENLKRALFIAVINNAISRITTSIVLLSTNIDDNPLYEPIITSLDDISNHKEIAHNPNSGNQIALWIISKFNNTDEDYDEDEL